MMMMTQFRLSHQVAEAQEKMATSSLLTSLLMSQLT